MAKNKHDRSRNRVGELLYGSYGPSHLTKLRGVVVAAPLARQLWQTAPLRRTAPVTEGLGAAKLTDTLSLRLHLAFLSSRAACTPTIKVKAFQPDLLILRDYEGMGLFTGSAGLGWH